MIDATSPRPMILVTNDDGFRSAGIIALAAALRSLGDVVVVAPERDQSGVGHALTIATPVRAAAVADRDVPTYRCSGTPADCVVVGAFDVCGRKPDLVVSGINRGANLGDDINYSGTVAAALEGVIIGIPSIAVSLAAAWPHEGGDEEWSTAAVVAADVAKDVLRDGLPAGVLLNVNVPNVATSVLRGTRVVRQGRKAYTDRLDKRTDPRGGTYYWIWGSFDASNIVAGTDLAAVRDGYASVTPIALDRTADDQLMRSFAKSKSY